MDYKALTKKIDDLKTREKADLSLDEDLSLAVMNLIALEEHFFFTGARTDKKEYYDWLDEARALRKILLAKLVGKHEGETWCAAKHLLSATMRLQEVGTKLQAAGKKNEAEEMFKQSFQTYSIFWGLRLKLLSLPDVKKEAASAAAAQPWTLNDIVNKLVNCCDE